MRQLCHPEEMFRGLRDGRFKESQCEQGSSQAENSLVKIQKEQVKREIIELERAKGEYLTLSSTKQKLLPKLKELMTVRQSIDYDQGTKQGKFKHENFPYRHHLYVKQELVEQRIVNRQKRMKIRDMEEEIRGLQRNVEDMRTAGARRTAVNARRDVVEIRRNVVGAGRSAVETKRSVAQVRRGAVGTGMSRERDCDEDFWLRKMQNIKTGFLSGESAYRRAKVKHDYNLLVQKTNCECLVNKICPICSDYNLQMSSNDRSYAREALLSPRYSRIYKSNR